MTAAADLLGIIGLFFGVILLLIGLFGGEPAAAIIGASMAASGFSCFIIAHIGRALIHIAQTNAAILEKLSEK